MIVTLDKLIKELSEVRDLGNKVVATSGGFDPLHVGHVACIQESASIATPHGVLVVIVNGDGFLTRKKGKPFMSHEERMKIVDALRGVDYVVGWDDGSQTVVGALEIIKPDVFCKGGDRSTASAVPEVEICQKIGCRISYGVGGDWKMQSSSDLIKNSKT
jgi:cytidyltransferase-like protein